MMPGNRIFSCPWILASALALCFLGCAGEAPVVVEPASDVEEQPLEVTQDEADPSFPSSLEEVPALLEPMSLASCNLSGTVDQIFSQPSNCSAPNRKCSGLVPSPLNPSWATLGESGSVMETSYIYIAAHALDQVAKVNINTGAKIWQKTSFGDSPSRTAVAPDNSVWVANRGFDRPSDPAYSNAVHLNADGGLICRVDATGIARGMAIDGNGNVYVGTWNSQTLYKVSGTQVDTTSCTRPPCCKVLAEKNLGVSMYGLTVDKGGYLWTSSSPVTKKIRTSDLAVVMEVSHGRIYGITSDKNGDIWMGSATGDLRQEYRPYTCRKCGWKKVGRRNVYTCWNENCYAMQQVPYQGLHRISGANGALLEPFGSIDNVTGVAVDNDGHVWAAQYQTNRIFRVNATNGAVACSASIPTNDSGGDPRGVALDSYGKVWVVPMKGGWIYRYNLDCTLDKAVLVSKGVEFYSYSDMTGFQQRTVSSVSGSWIQDVDAGQGAIQWRSLSFVADVPANTSLNATVFAGDSLDQLANNPIGTCGPFTTSPASLSTCAGLQGHRYARIVVNMTSANAGVKPTLKQVGIQAYAACANNSSTCSKTCYNPLTRTCANDTAIMEGASCNDGNACTFADACRAGRCGSGTLRVCNDGNPCTTDACNPASGLCAAVPKSDGSSCDDGVFCTSPDRCLSGRCAGTPRTCDDGNVWTTDRCNETLGVCEHSDPGGEYPPNDEACRQTVCTVSFYDRPGDCSAANRVCDGTGPFEQNPNWITLTQTTIRTPFIYIAVTGKNQVAKLSTATGEKLWQVNSFGTYPSRTAVALDYSVWVSNRGFDGTSDPSRSNAVHLDKDGSLLCRVDAVGIARGVALDGDGNAWIGSYNSGTLYKVSGTEVNATDCRVAPCCKVLGTLSTGVNIYGLAVDGQGYVWTASSPETVKVNTRTMQVEARVRHESHYGIAIDKDNSVWFGGWSGPGPRHTIHKIYRDASGQYRTMYTGVANVTAVAVDGQGNIWGSSYGTDEVVKLDPSTGQVLCRASTPNGSNPHGIGIDEDGKVWVPMRTGGYVNRFDANCQLEASFPVDAGTELYTYSDMTGAQLRYFTIREGHWVQYIDAGCSTYWADVTWNGQIPENTTVSVSFVGADTMEELMSGQASGEICGPFTAQNFSLLTCAQLNLKRYLMVDVRLTTSTDNLRPIFSGIRIDHCPSDIIMR